MIFKSLAYLVSVDTNTNLQVLWEIFQVKGINQGRTHLKDQQY